MPNKTPPAIEKKIMEIRRETGYGAIRISRIMKEREGIYVGVSAVRYVLKRNGVCNKKKRTKYRTRQRYYDFEKIYPLQNFEIDLKEILDMRALPPSTYHRAFGINHKLTFKTDNGEEFGGKSVNKLFSPLNCTLLHNPKGKWEYFSLWKEAIEQMMRSFIFLRLKNVKT